MHRPSAQPLSTSLSTITQVFAHASQCEMQELGAGSRKGRCLKFLHRHLTPPSVQCARLRKTMVHPSTRPHDLPSHHGYHPISPRVFLDFLWSLHLYYMQAKHKKDITATVFGDLTRLPVLMGSHYRGMTPGVGGNLRGQCCRGHTCPSLQHPVQCPT